MAEYTEHEPNQEKRRSLARFHCEAAAGSLENAGIAYQAPSLIAVGAGAQSLSFLSFLTNIVFSFFCINAPGIIQRLGSAKRVATALALINVFTWIPIIVVFIMGLKVSPILLVVLWVLNVLPGLFSGPLRDSWLADTLSSRDVGRYLGVRAFISGTGYLMAFYIMGFTLDYLSEVSLRGFGLVFIIAVTAAAATFFLYRKISPPSEPAQSGKGTALFGFGEFIREMAGHNLGKLIIFISLLSLAVNLSSPLFAAYMLKDLKLSYMTYTLIISSEFAARIVSVNIWSRYAQSAADLRILGVICRFVPFLPILWLFSSNIFYLVAIQMISGTVWAGFELFTQTIIFQTAPKNKRLKYIIYHKSLTTAGAAVGALAGAYLLTRMVPVFGNQILGLFLVSGIFRFVVVRAMFHRIVGTASPALEPAFLPHWNAVLAVRPGEPIYYRPEEWRQFMKPAAARKPRLDRKAVLRGCFNRPQDWSLFTGKRGDPVPAVVDASADVKLNKQPLFHDPDKWFFAKPVAESAPVESKPPKKPMLYHPENWEDFTAPAISNGQKATGEPGKNSKPGCLHHPERWDSFKPAPENKKQPVRLAVTRRRMPRWQSGPVPAFESAGF